MSEIPLGVFPSAKCALKAFKSETCETEWKKWCSGCNLVFCEVHAKPEAHNCRSLTEKPSPSGNHQQSLPLAPVEDKKSKRKKS